MTDRMSSLLPENKRQMTLNYLPRREPFEILYRLNCDNLCADFHEDLEFRFSWGITALINRFAGKQGQKLAIANYPQDVRSIQIKTIIVFFYFYGRKASLMNCFSPDSTGIVLSNRQYRFYKIRYESRNNFPSKIRRLVVGVANRYCIDIFSGNNGWLNSSWICK